LLTATCSADEEHDFRYASNDKSAEAEAENGPDRTTRGRGAFTSGKPEGRGRIVITSRFQVRVMYRDYAFLRHHCSRLPINRSANTISTVEIMIIANGTSDVRPDFKRFNDTE
jgi:hypothetical protein